MLQKKRNKIGRNDKCPCFSRKKFKNCHGSVEGKNNTYTNSSPIPNAKHFERLKALDIQRRRQQGLGNPITSTTQNDLRIIAVANNIYPGKWITFHDFLCDYIKIITGNDWGNNELKKPYENRHPLIKIYNNICEYQKTFVKNPGEVHSAPFTGAVSAYMWLSYNLYIIAHNATLQERLIKRLKHEDQFTGACYETYIAAIFIKAGFILEFENEEDNLVSHHEFLATHVKTGKKYSVEAKCRHRKNLTSKQGSEKFNLKINRLLHQALNKNTSHDRIIFIDLNLPTSEMGKCNPDYLTKRIRKCENDLINGNPAPPAYVFLTNYPYHYDLERTDYQTLYFVEGFKIADFGNKKITLHEGTPSKKKASANS